MFSAAVTGSMRGVPLVMTSRDDELAAFLAAPAPRRVPARLARAARRRGGSWAFMLFGLVFGGFGTIFVVTFFPWNIWRDWRLAAADTATAAGRIVAAEEMRMSINETAVWRYAFEFRPDDVLVSGASYSTGPRWRPGDAVTVRFRREAADIAAVAGARSSAGDGSSAFVVVFPLLGFGAIAVGWVRRRRAIALLQTGTLADARIVSVERTNTQINYQPVYKAALRIDAAGVTIPTVFRCHDPAVIRFVEERCASQQPVFAIYDPRHPKRVLLPETL